MRRRGRRLSQPSHFAPHIRSSGSSGALLACCYATNSSPKLMPPLPLTLLPFPPSALRPLLPSSPSPTPFPPHRSPRLGHALPPKPSLPPSPSLSSSLSLPLSPRRSVTQSRMFTLLLQQMVTSAPS
ncbi:hypothetical protein V8C86DRAFT_3145084 [Haematococcus lacustris]